MQQNLTRSFTSSLIRKSVRWGLAIGALGSVLYLTCYIAADVITTLYPSTDANGYTFIEQAFFWPMMLMGLLCAIMGWRSALCGERLGRIALLGLCAGLIAICLYAAVFLFITDGPLEGDFARNFEVLRMFVEPRSLLYVLNRLIVTLPLWVPMAAIIGSLLSISGAGILKLSKAIRR